MTQVLARPWDLPLADAASAAGTIHIEEDVIAKVAAQAASELPDIGCPTRGLGHLGADTLGARADLSRRPKASAQVDGDRAYLDLVVSVRWPAPVPQVTAALREHVRTRIEELTGLTVHTVNIEVADLITDTDTGARVH
ncbi:Asp23/Gls24 family envelope stress response protein [Catellatospora sp. NPDC049609]|uniref:Asp23/Gls24 family envelope stress response protein n=1 Tax=Catellatospora sp. NPDC049609 TaxID=3155505 RepID=UPI003436F945